jgi:hypothetical protein
MSPGSARRAPLLLSRPFIKQLLRLYDMPDPRCRTRLIRGYDGPHAVRTARMCAAVAQRLGYAPEIVKRYQIACLLHDLGRAGLDRRLFGRIWSWAKERDIPTRPREWRAAYPGTTYGRETEAFLARYRKDLEAAGISMEPWACEQVEMRLGYARRLARRLRQVQPRLAQLGVVWSPWMKQVMLYYYYPEKLVRARPWVKQLAEVLVACEQFEAYSNQRRGRDYYVRVKETLPEAFAYLEKLQREGLLSRAVVECLQRLAAEGEFDQILTEARGRPLSRRERLWLRRSCVKET